MELNLNEFGKLAQGNKLLLKLGKSDFRLSLKKFAFYKIIKSQDKPGPSSIQLPIIYGTILYKQMHSTRWHKESAWGTSPPLATKICKVTSDCGSLFSCRKRKAIPALKSPHTRSRTHDYHYHSHKMKHRFPCILEDPDSEFGFEISQRDSRIASEI